MKRLMMMFVVIVGFAVCSHALEAGLLVPNAEVTYFLDSDTRIPVIGGSSRFAFIGDFEARMGWYSKVTALGLSYDLRNLNKISWLHVQFAWPENWNLTIGAGAGIDFATSKVTTNLMTILLQIAIGGNSQEIK